MARELIQGTGVIVESHREPGAENTDPDGYGRDDGLLSELWAGAAGVPYAFVVEVTVPAQDPYRVSVDTRVPTKAEKLSLFETHPIPLTLEVPVVVDAKDPTRVAIDWKAFIALPDRVPRLKAARERALAIQVGRNVAAEPEKFAAQRAQNKVVVMGWAENVRAGNLTRAVVERDAGTLIRLGWMDPADLEAALARVDEP